MLFLLYFFSYSSSVFALFVVVVVIVVIVVMLHSFVANNIIESVNENEMQLVSSVCWFIFSEEFHNLIFGRGKRRYVIVFEGFSV